MEDEGYFIRNIGTGWGRQPRGVKLNQTILKNEEVAMAFPSTSHRGTRYQLGLFHSGRFGSFFFLISPGGHVKQRKLTLKPAASEISCLPI